MFRQVLFTIALILTATGARAQYYGWGRSPQNIKWNRIESASGKLVYPDYFTSGAARVSGYLNAIRNDITYGFGHPPIKIPTILHTQNFEANGIVMWAPKRMEFEAIPNIETYAEPWLKQLAVHESRHAVQYGNLYQGLMRPVGWLVGQHSGLVSSALMPLWFLEGDAVQTETQMSSFGRALQPSFTIEYRAYFTEINPDFPMDKWFCGSYKDYIPNHYQFGYQLTAWSRERYGDDMWSRIADYSSRRPYTIIPTKFSLKKYYNTSVTEIARGTIADLRDFWLSQPVEENTSEVIPTPLTSYTTYSAPMPLNDSTVYVLKSDMDRTSRIMRVDPRTGEEEKITYTGSIVTTPVMLDSVIYWSEYRNSVLWEQKVSAVATSYDLRTGRRRDISGRKNALFPTPAAGEILSVGYDYRGNFTLDADGKVIYNFPDTVSVHGLAFDDRTGTIAFIGLHDKGMFLGRLVGTAEGGYGFRYITRPSRVTIYGLRAGAGVLTFNSIASGKDEIHYFDLAEGLEYRITTSRYGSVSPSAGNGSGRLFFTTYTPDGYLLASQEIGSEEEVGYMEIPTNTVNPQRRKWDVMNMDTVASQTYLPADVKVKKYRKGLNLFNIHSWAPVSFDPISIIDESRFDFGFGATIVSQDLLHSTTGFLSYGYSGAYHHRLRGALNYYGLAPKFEVSFDWGNGKQLVYGINPGIDDKDLKENFQITGKAYLPMSLGSGRRYRTLTPSVELMHINSRLYHAGESDYSTGYQRMVTSVTYVDNARMAKRDLYPRTGYALRASLVNAPFTSGFSKLYAVYGRVYLPGISLHHSLILRGNYQYQTGNDYNFRYKEVFPRGANYNIAVNKYAAASVDYSFPAWYPDLGLNGFLYLKRIWVNLYYDYARYNTVGNTNYRNVTSYGGTVNIDMHILRIPVNTSTLGVSVYKPNDRKGVVVGVNFSLPL